MIYVGKYTHRSMGWELANSWWILLIIFPLGAISVIGFLYAGFKVENHKWKIYGLIYLTVFVVAFIVTKDNSLVGYALLSWVISIVHALMIRPAFLVQLDVLQTNRKKVGDPKITKLREEAEAKFGITANDITQPAQSNIIIDQEVSITIDELTSPPDSDIVTTEEIIIKKIDINTASESEIAAIPEIGIILAKKVVIKRKELGSFQSFEQFSQTMDLKEHTIEKLEKILVFSNNANTTIQTKKGRIVDY